MTLNSCEHHVTKSDAAAAASLHDNLETVLMSINLILSDEHRAFTFKTVTWI